MRKQDVVGKTVILAIDHGTKGDVLKKYRVIRAFPNFALCISEAGGYRECFSWSQIGSAT